MIPAALRLDEFLARFTLMRPPASPPARHRRQAAVLIPILRCPQPALLLTVRSAHLRHHQGQVAFPGGAYDAQDSSLIHTALRETEEEIGLSRHQIEVIGSLPPVDSVSGFCVTPVIGLLPANARWKPNPAEVAESFLIPLARALSLRHYRPFLQRPLFWYRHYLIWGMTAGILHRLGQQIAH